MDIVAESLSANILKARNVTVRGQDVLKWFESKLSASVSFVGVFDDLSAAPVRNGAVAIVGSKDYIYSSTTSAWQEFGDEGQIGVLTQAVAALSSDISSCATSSDVDSALSAKRDLLDLLYMVKPQSPDAFDKWVLTGPIEKYSKVVLAPYDDPDPDQEAGEMAWGWWADEVIDGRCAYLTWNGESVWTLLVRDGLLTYLSASTGGEWNDLSVSFTGENGEWVIDRAAEADMLALDRNVKKWVENQNYLTEHQDITGKQDKISVDGILSCDGDGNVAAVKMPQNISDLSNDVGYLSVELEPAFAAVSSTFLTAHQDLSGYYQKTETSSAAEIQAALSGKQPSGNYLTGEEEPAFAAVSSTFLTAHQDLSGYYRKAETSSAVQLQALQNATGVSIWSDPYQANDNATDPTGPAIWFYPRAFGAPDGAYINTITIHTTATKQSDIPGTSVYARIYREGEETNPLADSWPVNVISVDTLYTFNLKKEVPLDSNRKYGVRFYRSDNSNVAKIGYHLYAYHKTEGGPYPNPGTDIAYGAWNDTAGKNLLRPALSVSWTAGIQHSIPADLSDFTNSPGYLVSNDISDYYTKSETEALSAVVTEWVETQGYLTAHQSLSGYYQRSETSSAAEIAAALSDIKVPPDFSTALSGKSYYYGMDFAGVLSALRDVLSAMGGRIQGAPL